MWTIRPEQPGDNAAIDTLTAQSFGAGRYAKTAYRLREGVAADSRLGFVAEAEIQTEGQSGLIGSVRFWPIVIGEELALLLGPLAVQPRLRGRGIGIGLMQRGLEEARKLGYRTVILIGDEPYYARVGFARLQPGQIRFPGPVNSERILGLALAPGALETLKGPVNRAKLDDPICAAAAPLGG